MATLSFYAVERLLDSHLPETVKTPKDSNRSRSFATVKLGRPSPASSRVH